MARTKAKASGKPMPAHHTGKSYLNGNLVVEDIYDPEELDKVPLPMPKNFVTSFEYTDMCSKVDKNIQSTFDGYFRGDLSIKDVTKMMDDSISSLIETYSKIGFDPAEITPKIIEDVYNHCRSEITISVREASFREGGEVAKQFPEYKGGGGLYYSADLYYKTEDTIDAVLEHAQTLAEKYGVSSQVALNRGYSADTPTGRLMKSLNESYNTAINKYYRENYVCANIIDETIAPPKGFRMFFTKNEGNGNRYDPSMGPGDGPYSVYDGGVHIWYGDWSFSRRVPIGAAGTELPCAANLLDVVKNSEQAYPKAISDFLANFDFFSGTRCAEYLGEHPRKF